MSEAKSNRNLVCKLIIHCELLTEKISSVSIGSNRQEKVGTMKTKTKKNQKFNENQHTGTVSKTQTDNRYYI